MEENNNNTQIVFDNDIALFLDQFCKEQNIKDLKEESQNVWNGCMMYIRRHVFPTTEILKSKELINNNNNIMPSTYNRYNFKLLNTIADYYIYICSLYDKEISINGFSYLTGIETSVIYAWVEDNNKLSTEGMDIYKKLSEKREESLSAKLATAKRNPVGILAILNRHYQWNLPGVSREKTEPHQIRTAEEIRQLYGQMEPAELPEPPKD